MAWVVLEGGVSEPNRYHLKRSLKPNKEKLIQILYVAMVSQLMMGKGIDKLDKERLYFSICTIHILNSLKSLWLRTSGGIGIVIKIRTSSLLKVAIF